MRLSGAEPSLSQLQAEVLELAQREAERRLAAAQKQCTAAGAALTAAQTQHEKANGVYIGEEPSDAADAVADLSADTVADLGADSCEATIMEVSLQEESNFDSTVASSAAVTGSGSSNTLRSTASVNTANISEYSVLTQAHGPASILSGQTPSQLPMQESSKSFSTKPLALSKGGPNSGDSSRMRPRVTTSGARTSNTGQGADPQTKKAGTVLVGEEDYGEITKEVGMSGFEDVLSAWASAVGLDPQTVLASDSGVFPGALYISVSC